MRTAGDDIAEVLGRLLGVSAIGTTPVATGGHLEPIGWPELASAPLLTVTWRNLRLLPRRPSRQLRDHRPRHARATPSRNLDEPGRKYNLLSGAHAKSPTLPNMATNAFHHKNFRSKTGHLTLRVLLAV